MTSHVRRLAFIDSLRAIAILGVISVRTAQWVQPSSSFLLRVTEEGARGVQLFFMASALTIFLSIKSRSADEYAPVRNYFIRRFFRIAPLLYIGMLIWLFVSGFEPRYWAPNGIDGWTVLLTGAFLHGFHPETITSLVPGGWFIAVEMTFYLIAPLLYLYIKDMPSAIAFFLATLLLNRMLTGVVVDYWLAVYPPEQQYLASSYGLLWFVAQLPIFALGVIVFHAIGDRLRERPRLLGYSLLVMVVVLWVAFLDARSYLGLLPSYIYYGASFMLLMLSLAAHPTRLLVNPVMCGLGKISFSLYIFHFVILHVFDALAFPDGFPFQGGAGFWGAWILVVATSSALPLITYRLVDRPGVAVGAYLIVRLERKNAWQSSVSSVL